MEEERKITVVVLESGGVTVAYTGKHISKRELNRALTAIKLEYGTRVKAYRRKILNKKNIKQSEELKNANSKRNTEQSGTESADSNGATSSSSHSGTGTNEDVKDNNSTGGTVSTGTKT
jgi:hypothetical protein